MSYDGTLTRGTPSYVAGKFGNALAGGVYTLPVIPNMTVWTVELWVKSTQATGAQVAFGSAASSPAGFWLGMSAGKAAYNPPNGTLTASTIAVNDGAWHHLAATGDGTNVRLWVDGVLGNTTPDTFQFIPGTGTAIGGFGTNTTFDFAASGGQIDEVRVSNVVRYTTGFTAPTAAFTDDGNTVALYHLESSAVDSHAGAVTPPSAPTISVTTSGGTDTISYTAATAGTNPIAGYALYVGATSGGESTTAFATNAGAGASTFTHATGSYYTVKAYDNAATPNYSAPSNEVTTAVTVIAPNDANIVYSPYNWLVGTTAKTINAGAYLRCMIGGSPASLTATFDVAQMANPASQIAYRVDGGPWTNATVAASVPLTIPASGAAWARHSVEIVVKASTETANRWNSPWNTSVVLTGIVCGTGGCTTTPIQKRALNVAVFGDSITEGVRAINSSATNDTDRNDATLGWAYRLTETLGAEVGVIGFGAQGVDQGGAGGVPAATSSYSLLWAGQARSWAVTPDVIVINLGANGGSQAGYTTLLNGLLAATPTSTLIAAMRPFGGQQAANIQAAIAACNAPARVKYIDTTGWWDGADASDGLHPYGNQNVTKLAPYLAAAVRTLLKRGAIYRLGASSPSDKLISPTRL